MSNDLSVWRLQMEASVVSTMRSMSAISKGMAALGNRVDSIENEMRKRIYLSNTHLIMVKKAAKERAAAICKEKSFEYKKAYRFIIQAIWRSINDQYNVPSCRELPEAYYKEIVEHIEAFNLPSVVEDRIRAA